MSVDLEAARALLKKGKTKIVEKERASVSELLAQAQLNADKLQEREKTLVALVERDRAQIAVVRQEMLELEECAHALEPAEYDKAIELFKSAVSALTSSLKENEGRLSAIQEELRTVTEQVSCLRDRSNQLIKDPDGFYIPGLDLPVADETCNPSIAKYAETAAGDIRRIKRLVDSQDYKGALLVATILSARVRRASAEMEKDRSLSPFDHRMVKRLLGAIGLVCGRLIPKDVNGLDTYIPCLRADWTPHAGWTQFIADALAEQSRHHGGAVASSPAPDADAPKEDTSLMSAVVNTGLVNKTKGKRVAFFGGLSTRGNAKKLLEWVQDALQMDATWYDGDRPTGLARSIKSGGTDLLVILAGFVSHGHIDYFKAEVPDDFPTLTLHSLNPRVFTSSVARMCGIADFEKELK